MKFNKIVSVLLLFIFCLSTCSCKSNKEKDLKIYRNFYDQDVTTFNYLTTNALGDYMHIANFVDGLVENDKYGNIVPSIAQSWKSEIISNKQVWTFYLREDAYWSDYKGKLHSLVTSHDFVTSLRYILNYNIHSNNYSLPATLLENGMNYYYGTTIKNYNYNDIIDKIEKLEKKDSNNELNSYINILNAFDYCNHNSCTTNFESVGVKAINDFELQFTLSHPSPYFLSALTYCSFLPVNEKFLETVGFNNFGNNKKQLLYNGAYILKDYYHSSRIEYIKNNNYWDKDKVYIDKIIFNRLINYPSASYTRLSYETGNSDSFYVNRSDEKGWKKYVEGNDNSGNSQNPVGNNTYVIEETNNFTTYHFIFNQNRSISNYSSLSKDEIRISNLALSNQNFRKALIHGINGNTSSISLIDDVNSTIIPPGFFKINNQDYQTYFIKEYAKTNNISYEEALSLKNNDNLIYDENKSNQFLSLALEELSLPQENLPIKIEFSYFSSPEYASYDRIRVKEWNNVLNGCPSSSKDCDYTKVEIIYNEKISTYNDFASSLQSKDYSISFIGLHPNYMDPISYLESFSNIGELSPYLNHSYGKEISDYLDNIRKYYEGNDLDLRYKFCAELEYKIIFEYALVLPLMIKDSSNKILVSNLVPFESMKANYGLSSFKFKLRKIRDKTYTQSDILKLKEEYKKGSPKK